METQTRVQQQLATVPTIDRTLMEYERALEGRKLSPNTIKSVHPSGNPMSHSTHVGFNAPISRDSDECCVEDSRFFQSVALGVGSIFAAPVRVIRRSRLPLLSRCQSPDSRARGVGNSFTARASVGRTAAFGDWLLFVLPPRASTATGVGHDEDPVPNMRRTNGGSRYAVPFRIVPERGQVAENTVKSSIKESCDVFHEHVAGS